MMSATLLKQQMRKTSTLHIECIAYDMRYTFASGIGMAFELAIEDLILGQEPMTFQIRVGWALTQRKSMQIKYSLTN